MPHYDTTHEGDDMLRQYEKQTATQDNRIACFFESNPGEIFTPWEIQAMVFTDPAPPITSVRRSMSDLTKAHILTKTEFKKMGEYNRRSYAWTLNEKYRETLEILVYTPETTFKDVIEAVLPTEVAEAILGSESTDGPKTSPQGKLFNVPPIKDPPVHCCVCNRELTDPASIVKGIGPVCSKKCRENAELFTPTGKKLR